LTNASCTRNTSGARWSVGRDETPDGDPDELDWVADRVDRQLIRIDTNFKPSRRSDHPVDLTRSDAVRLAVALLRATDDTFHYVQRGRLRPTEAAELLLELGELDYALAELRGHALGDLLHDSTMNSGPPAVR
jgi:hypothetical protein